MEKRKAPHVKARGQVLGCRHLRVGAPAPTPAMLAPYIASFKMTPAFGEAIAVTAVQAKAPDSHSPV